MSLIVAYIILIHWTTCYYCYLVYNNWKKDRDAVNEPDADPKSYYTHENGLKHPVFNFNFWIPQVDLNDKGTHYYEEPSAVRYVQSFYYLELLLVGNDINPQNKSEINCCIIFLFIGAITEAMLFGGIAAEMQTMNDKYQRR